MKLSVIHKRIIAVLSLVIVIFLVYFCIRGFLLELTVKKLNAKLQHDYKLELNIKQSGFKGFRSILLSGLIVKDTLNDAVVLADTLFLQVKVFPLFTGKIRYRKIHISNFSANLNDEILDRLFHSGKIPKPKSDSIPNIHYSKTINNIFNNYISWIPREVRIDSAVLRLELSKIKFKIFCPEFRLLKNKFSGLMNLSDSIVNSDCQVKGSINRCNKYIDLTFCQTYNKTVNIPYLNQRWGLSVKFDTLRFSFSYMEYKRQRLSFAWFCKTNNLYIKHKNISPVPVITSNITANLLCHTGDKYIELDSSSVITVNHFNLSPYFKYQNYNDKEISFRIPHFDFNADGFFKSFPEGLFTSVHGMKVSGCLAFELNCYINLTKPDSVNFSSMLCKEDFKILHYGATNPGILNDTFTYHIYEQHDQPVKAIYVSPDNPGYSKTEEISPFLRYSVLASEDGSFFYHNGFNEESFKNSITQNIKEKRFARGGSTITMQLVKNVFLNHNKTISRKLEEMLIVWIIENFHLVSKERMFEIYLNIIEWGPGIYGIKQASMYYFKKLPSELNLQESIFLACIIPSPRYFKYAFNDEGKLKNYYCWFYKRLPDFMVHRNQILPEDTIGLKPEITLTGEAKEYLLKPDTTIIDSAEFIEHIYLRNDAIEQK